MLMVIKRGDIFYADLRPVVGSEQGGIRPVIVLQNDAGNKYSPTIICAAITSKMNKAKLPTHVPIDCHRCELEKDSVILLEQIRTYILSLQLFRSVGKECKIGRASCRERV